MPMQITPELREWMKLYEAPFEYDEKLNVLFDSDDLVAMLVQLLNRRNRPNLNYQTRLFQVKRGK